MSASQKRCRLMFLCVPRSTSTAVLKSLSFFDDSEVWFEPYVNCRVARIEYRLNTGQDLPPKFEGNEEVYKKAADDVQKINKIPLGDGHELSYSYVKDSLEKSTKRIVIAKDMGLAIAGQHDYLPSAESGYKYIFIIRDPYRAVTSYKRAIGRFWKRLGQLDSDKGDVDFDLLKDDRFYPRAGGFYADLYEAWRYVRANLDPDPLIIDSEDFLSNPKAYLKKICEVGGLEYHDGLLQWDASSDVILKWRDPGITRIMDTTLVDFHNNTLSSSGFHRSSSDRPIRSGLSADVLKAIDAGIEYYNEMYEQRYQP